MTPPGSTHIALLRGINVGGKNKLPMKALASFFEQAGCHDVRTYIQSGNVVYRAPEDLAAEIPARVRQAITDEFGYSVPLVVRTTAELAAVVERNPFLASDSARDEPGQGGPGKADPDPKTLHVAFLAERPTEAQVSALDPDRSPGDTFRVLGREIYLHCPNGLARTKLTNAWFDSRLDTVSTMRNWRTTRKLLSMASGA